MQEELSAALLKRLSRLSSREIIELPFKKEQINGLLDKALQTIDVETFAAAVKVKYFFAKKDLQWSINIPKITVALLYLLSESLFSEKQYLSYEKIFMSVFVIWCEKQKLAQEWESSQKIKIVASIRKIIYVLESSIKDSSAEEQSKERRTQIKIITAFYSILFNNHLQQKLEAQINDHLTFIFKNQRAIPFLKLCQLMQFALLNEQQKAQAIINRVECVSNNPKLSLCIEMVCLLARVVCQYKHIFRADQIQYLQRLFQATVSQQIFTRTNLKIHQNYFLYHLTHQLFFNPLIVLFQQNLDDQIILEWKNILKMSLQKQKQNCSFSLSQGLLYISLLKPQEQFPGIQSSIVASLCTHPFFKIILKQKQNVIKNQTNNKSQWSKIQISNTIIFQIRQKSIDFVYNVLSQMNLIQKAIFIFYFYYGLVKINKKQANSKQFCLQKLRIKMRNILQMFTLQQLIQFLSFLIFELKIASSSSSIATLQLLIAEICEHSYNYCFTYLFPPYKNLICNIASFYSLRYYSHILSDAIIELTSFKKKRTTLLHCKGCLITSINYICQQCKRECVSFCLPDSNVSSILQDTSSMWIHLEQNLEQRIRQVLVIIPGGFTSTLLKKCLFSKDHFNLNFTVKIKSQSKINLQDYALHLDSLLK